MPLDNLFPFKAFVKDYFYNIFKELGHDKLTSNDVYVQIN
ncbi:hypothetical protein QE390_003157 [Siphonobacter sp. SORGH_AS 1065]|nr:hypothetical protein [Siphonobacter sp. SORGH_AS_1065]